MGTDDTTRLDSERQTAIADRYRRLSQAFADKVAAVPEDRWASPSPCEDWTARDVVQHVVDSSSNFLGFVERKPASLPSAADDPVAAFDQLRGAVQSELDDPDRAAATFQGYRGTTTLADAVDTFLAMDLVVHGWDLAQAAGLEDTIDPAELRRVSDAADDLGDMLRSPRAFGPEVPVPEGADEQRRLLARLGREA